MRDSFCQDVMCLSIPENDGITCPQRPIFWTSCTTLYCLCPRFYSLEIARLHRQTFNHHDEKKVSGQKRQSLFSYQFPRFDFFFFRYFVSPLVSPYLVSHEFEMIRSSELVEDPGIYQMSEMRDLAESIELELHHHCEDRAFHDGAAWKLKRLVELIKNEAPHLLEAQRSYASVSRSTGLLMLRCINASGGVILKETHHNLDKGWCVYKTHIDDETIKPAVVDPPSKMFFSELKDAFTAFLQLRQ